jgi:hypothetical protein
MSTKGIMCHILVPAFFLIGVINVSYHAVCSLLFQCMENECLLVQWKEQGLNIDQEQNQLIDHKSDVVICLLK